MHVSEYCVLNSINKDVVLKSIDEINYHYKLLKAFNVKPSIVIHVGSNAFGKKNSISRFINNFKKLAMTVEMDSGETVEYIDYRNPQDVYVKIPTVNIRLGSFNSGTYDKIHRLPSLLPQVKMLNKKVKYVDLRWDSNYIKLDE